MRFAVVAKVTAVGIKHHDGVEEALPGALEERDGQHDAEFLRDGREVPHGGVFLQRFCQREEGVNLILAEVQILKKFLDQNNLRTLRRRRADQLFGVGNVGRGIWSACHLRGGDGNVSRISPATAGALI